MAVAELLVRIAARPPAEVCADLELGEEANGLLADGPAPTAFLMALLQGGHFADFARGIISLGDIAYYLSVTAVFLVLTVVVLEARRLR